MFGLKYFHVGFDGNLFGVFRQDSFPAPWIPCLYNEVSDCS